MMCEPRRNLCASKHLDLRLDNRLRSSCIINTVLTTTHGYQVRRSASRAQDQDKKDIIQPGLNATRAGNRPDPPTPGEDP